MQKMETYLRAVANFYNKPTGRWVLVGTLLFSMSFFLSLRVDSVSTRMFEMLRINFVLEHQFLSCIAEENDADSADCIQSNVGKWNSFFDLPTIVAQLDQYEEDFGSDLRCHLAAHEIGKYIMESSTEGLPEVMRLCTQSCSSGCIHGGTLSYVEKNGSDGLIASNPEYLCARYASKQFHLCIHGLGHAFMAGTGYDLEASLAACEKTKISSALRMSCNSGVFMELFETAQGRGHARIPPEDYYREGDLFYPCTKDFVLANDRYARACFIQQVPLLFQRNTQEDTPLIELCKRAPGKGGEYCAIGVGLGRAFSAPTDTEGIRRACLDTNNTHLRDRCLYGAVYFLRLVEDTVQEQALCESLTSEESKVCAPLYFDKYVLDTIINNNK